MKPKPDMTTVDFMKRTYMKNRTLENVEDKIRLKPGMLIKVDSSSTPFWCEAEGYTCFIKANAPICMVLSTHKRSSTGSRIIEFVCPWDHKILSIAAGYVDEQGNPKWCEIVE